MVKLISGVPLHLCRHRPIQRWGQGTEKQHLQSLASDFNYPHSCFRSPQNLHLQTQDKSFEPDFANNNGNIIIRLQIAVAFWPWKTIVIWSDNKYVFSPCSCHCRILTIAVRRCQCQRVQPISALSLRILLPNGQADFYRLTHCLILLLPPSTNATSYVDWMGQHLQGCFQNIKELLHKTLANYGLRSSG